MSFFTPPLKQKSAQVLGQDAESFTLSQGKKKRSMKQLNMADDAAGDVMSENDSKAFNVVNTLASIQDDSSSSSDSECEVFFDSKPPKADVLPAQATNSFALDFQVSSVAVDRGGRFVVAGFNNGTIRLYPLRGSTAPVVVGSLETDDTTSIDENKLVFRKGVVLDHISARGMYTQLRVNVVIPDDGRFIFAGVYRGSTEILVIEIDSIRLPTDVVGVPTAEVNTHSYSDAKLRGFGAVRAMPGRKASSVTTEYQVLCGLGIKNLHLWRFFWDPTSDDDESKWTWQCIFDRQTNGISLEYLAFGSAPNQIISKSEHQTVRVWTIDETSDAMTFDFVDIKQTQDTVQVCGQYAFGGQERLALVNLDSAQRLELDLPTSIAPTTRPTLNNRKRQLRTVTLLSGIPDGITLGVCSDGSVFAHDMASETGLGVHSPPAPVTGYDAFYQDQASLLSLLPCDGGSGEKEWMVVMANTTQLQVLSLNEFLHLPPATKVKTRPEPAKQSRKVSKKRSIVVAKPEQPVSLKRNVETEPKKAKKTSSKAKQGPPSAPHWSYDVVAPVSSSDESKKRKEMPPLVMSTPEPKKRKDVVEAVVDKVEKVQHDTIEPPAVIHISPALPKDLISATQVPPSSPENSPRPVPVEPTGVELSLYQTPEPKKVKVREVLSPVVSISPSSSPCTALTPPQPATAPVKDWSPFVIPKKTKAPAFVLDEPPTAAPAAPPSPNKSQTEAAANVSPSQDDIRAAEPEPAQPHALAPVETQGLSVDSCDAATEKSIPPLPHKFDVRDVEPSSPTAPSEFMDESAPSAKCAGVHPSLLMQVTCMQLDQDVEMDPQHQLADPEVATATTDRFQAERSALVAKFQGAHHDLIRRVCTQMHGQQQSVADRLDPLVIRERFRVEVRDLMGLQQLEADALCASQLMQWTVLGLGGFDMPRLVPAFPAPRLFG